MGAMTTDRFAPFPTQPTWSINQLRATSLDFDQKVASRSDIMALLTTGQLDVRANQVKLGATNVAPVSGFVSEKFGSTTALGVSFDPNKPQRKITWLEEGVRAREMNHRLYAGDWYRSGPNDGGCTLAFGAWEEKGSKPNGAPIMANYALSAGHCYGVGVRLYRAGYKFKEGKKVEDEIAFGTSERRSNGNVQAGFETDALAIRLDKSTEVPRWVYWSAGYQSMINGAADWIPGRTLCHSGTWGGTHCGPTAAEPVKAYYEGASAPTWQIRVFDYSESGDSGSAVWDLQTGSAIGLLNGGPRDIGGPTDIAPLLPLEGKTYAKEVGLGTSPRALAAPGMNAPAPLNIVDAVNELNG